MRVLIFILTSLYLFGSSDLVQCGPISDDDRPNHGTHEKEEAIAPKGQADLEMNSLNKEVTHHEKEPIDCGLFTDSDMEELHGDDDEMLAERRRRRKKHGKFFKFCCFKVCCFKPKRRHGRHGHGGHGGDSDSDSDDDDYSYGRSSHRSHHFADTWGDGGGDDGGCDCSCDPFSSDS